MANHVGDRLPAALARYYDALDGGRIDDAVAAFAPEARYAVPRAGAAEVDARRVVEGRDALRAYLVERGAVPRRHDVQLCVVAGGRALVEGVTRHAGTGAAETSFAASATLAPDGTVARYLAFAGTPVPDLAPADAVPGPPADGGGVAPARAEGVLHAYFAALDRGAFDEAAGCFSPDVLYVHPPYRHTGIDDAGRVAFRGRGELRAAFARRGAQGFGHRLVATLQRGPFALVEGVVEGLPGGGTGSFVSSLTLDAAGLVRRYVSFYCEPSVP